MKSDAEYKELSIREFTKAAEIYDSGHAGIYEMCRDDYPPILDELKKDGFEDLLDVGCGFDDKFSQVDNGQIEWFDVDLPDQVAVRRKVYEDRPRCTMLDGDALDGAWTEQLPKDRSTTIVVMEGVLEYFTRSRRPPACTCSATRSSTAGSSPR